MKLWDLLAICLLLVTTISSSPMFQSLQSRKTSYLLEQLGDFASVLPEETEFYLESKLKPDYFHRSPSEKQYATVIPYADTLKHVDFIRAAIGRQRRSSEWQDGFQTREEWQRKRQRKNGRRRHRKKGSPRDTSSGLGQGCKLKQIHLNVMDLGLGYRTQEELIFKYCSGPCVDAETNYDKILNNLTHKKKLNQDVPARTCCRPVAFDDDLSFLDDSLVYHILKKHSAKKCGCV